MSAVEFTTEGIRIEDQGVKHAIPNQSNKNREHLAVEVDGNSENTNLKKRKKTKLGLNIEHNFKKIKKRIL